MVSRPITKEEYEESGAIAERFRELIEIEAHRLAETRDLVSVSFIMSQVAADIVLGVLRCSCTNNAARRRNLKKIAECVGELLE